MSFESEIKEDIEEFGVQPWWVLPLVIGAWLIFGVILVSSILSVP